MATEKEKLDLDVYDNARAQVLGEKPAYAGTYENQLADIYDRIQNREKFDYNVNADPLYQQYKDQYIQGGKLAMRDTMGKAAALNGGYGSTYGQQVGQQAYDSYLQNLTNAIPELYQTAYNKYTQEGNDLVQQYGMVGDMRDTEYNKWRTDVGDWENQRAWDYQVEQDAWNRQQQEEQWAYQKQQQAYSNLYQAILQTGYKPTDAELKAAGMTRAQANNAKAMWDRTYAPKATGGGYVASGSPKKAETETKDTDIVDQWIKQGLSRGEINGKIVQATSSGDITAAQARTLTQYNQQNNNNKKWVD